jgi:hypothetical protein
MSGFVHTTARSAINDINTIFARKGDIIQGAHLIIMLIFHKKSKWFLNGNIGEAIVLT